MESLPEAASKLKYKIKPKLAELTEVKRVKIKRKLTERTGISGTSYSRYINCRTDETTDIPGQVLLEFADLLHCDIDDLFNND